MVWVTVIEPSIALANAGVATSRSPMPEKWRRMIEVGAGELGPLGFLVVTSTWPMISSGKRSTQGCRVFGRSASRAQALRRSRSADHTIRY